MSIKYDNFIKAKEAATIPAPFQNTLTTLSNSLADLNSQSKSYTALQNTSIKRNIDVWSEAASAAQAIEDSKADLKTLMINKINEISTIISAIFKQMGNELNTSAYREIINLDELSKIFVNEVCDQIEINKKFGTKQNKINSNNESISSNNKIQDQLARAMGNMSSTQNKNEVKTTNEYEENNAIGKGHKTIEQMPRVISQAPLSQAKDYVEIKKEFKNIANKIAQLQAELAKNVDTSNIYRIDFIDNLMRRFKTQTEDRKLLGLSVDDYQNLADQFNQDISNLLKLDAMANDALNTLEKTPVPEPLKVATNNFKNKILQLYDDFSDDSSMDFAEDFFQAINQYQTDIKAKNEEILADYLLKPEGTNKPIDTKKTTSFFNFSKKTPEPKSNEKTNAFAHQKEEINNYLSIIYTLIDRNKIAYTEDKKSAPATEEKTNEIIRPKRY